MITDLFQDSETVILLGDIPLLDKPAGGRSGCTQTSCRTRGTYFWRQTVKAWRQKCVILFTCYNRIGSLHYKHLILNIQCGGLHMLKGAQSRLNGLKSLAKLFNLVVFQSVSIFSILNYPCSFMV